LVNLRALANGISRFCKVKNAVSGAVFVGLLLVIVVPLITIVIMGIVHNVAPPNEVPSSHLDTRPLHCQTLKEEMDGLNLLRDWTDQKIAPLVADYDWGYSFKCDQETGAWAIRRGFTLMNGSIRYSTVCSSDLYCDMRPGQ